MKKLFLLVCMVFSFTALTFAKSLTPANDAAKKSAIEFVTADDASVSDVLAQADEPTKQKIQNAISKGGQPVVIEDGDLIIIIIIWDDGTVDVIIIELR